MRREPFTPPPSAPGELRDLLRACRAGPQEFGPRFAVLDWCEASPAHVSDAIGEVMAADPDLTLCGLGVDYDRFRDAQEVRDRRFTAFRARLASTESHRQFALGLCWLVTRAPRTGFNTRESAYRMKHYAERFMSDDEYVANGALVAAALYLGIPVKRADREPHAFLKVSAEMVGERERRRAEKEARRAKYLRRLEENRRRRCFLPPLPPLSQ